jgi:hypothetical protein
MTEKVKIAKIGRKQQPSKFKPGDTYSITTILVPECSKGKNQKLTAMGAWTDSWKLGDIVEGIIEEKKWTDKDGFEQISLSLTNPNKKTFTPGGGRSFNPLITAYEIAASLAPLIFAGKKKVMLDDIDKLANAIKSKIEVQPAAPAEVKEEKVKKIDVDKEEDEDESDDTEVTDDEDDTF